MDGLKFLGKDVWKMIVERLKFQSQRTNISLTCKFFRDLISKTDYQFASSLISNHASFKILKIRFLQLDKKVLYNTIRLYIDGFGEKYHTYNIKHVRTENGFHVYELEDNVLIPPIRLKNLNWIIFSPVGLVISKFNQMIPDDLNTHYFCTGNLFSNKELVIGSFGENELICCSTIKLLPEF